jgi:hypothetical protein
MEILNDIDYQRAPVSSRGVLSLRRTPFDSRYHCLMGLFVSSKHCAVGAQSTLKRQRTEAVWKTAPTERPFIDAPTRKSSFLPTDKDEASFASAVPFSTKRNVAVMSAFSRYRAGQWPGHLEQCHY